LKLFKNSFEYLKYDKKEIMKLSPDFLFICFGAAVSAEGEGRWASALPQGARSRVQDGEQSSRRYRHGFNTLFLYFNLFSIYS